MERVTGIGGFFFRAKDYGMLAKWYEQHFGIRRVATSYEQGSWWQDEGPTVFEPFAADSANHFVTLQQPWMLNLRVRDLDAMIAQLRAADIAVEIDPEQYPNGRFAFLHDPEGNPIQLWQAEGTDAKRPPDQ